MENDRALGPAIPETAPQPGRHLLADGCLLATTLIWGVNILVFKYTIDVLDPVLFNSSRLAFSLLALALCVWGESRWRKAPLWPRSNPDHPIPWPRVLVFAALTGLVYLVLYLMGIDRTTAGNTALLLSSMPMWTAVLSFLFLRERLPGISWVGLALTFAGTLIVTLTGGKVSTDSQHFWGNLLMLMAAFTWASATVLSRPILRAMTPLQLTFIASLLTTPLHLLWIAPQLAQLEFQGWSGSTAAVSGLAESSPSTGVPLSDNIAKVSAAAGSALPAGERTITPQILLALVYCGGLSTGVAYALWNTGVKILGGSHAAVYQNVVTLVAVIGGWLILREQPRAGQIVGGLTIIAGVLIMRMGRRTEARRDPA